MPPLSFRARACEYRRLLCSHVADGGPVHLLTGMPGNIGDQLIWAGTEDLLRSAAIGFGRLDVGDVEAFQASEGSLVIPGSGALTRLWHEWLPDLVLRASRRFRRVVLLPSQYDASVGIVAEALAQPNVYAFAREARSYREVSRFGRAAPAFDPAIYFEHFPAWDGNAPAICETTSRLIAFREDKGSLLGHHGFIPNPELNRDISLKATGLEDFLAAIFSVEMVVTDRLHVAVAAVMSGKRLLFLDPYDQKISTYFSFTFRDEFVERAGPCSLEWLVASGFIIARS
jgi:exopolysaccharide biosynthesis predicted pyruvyltransferase EpsI